MKQMEKIFYNHTKFFKKNSEHLEFLRKHFYLQKAVESFKNKLEEENSRNEQTQNSL